jgi:acyl dehydratase
MMVENLTVGGHAGLGSPGVDQIRWLKPVYPGDTLRVETVVTEVRPSRSKPDIGTVHSDITVFNQNDEPVMTMKSIGLVRRRPA